MSSAKSRRSSICQDHVGGSLGSSVYSPLKWRSPCKLRHESFKCKKSCQDNLYCLVNYTHPSEGIWDRDTSKFIQSHLGTNLNDQHRTHLQSPIRLKNLGATCYLNVLMQCLYHNKLIRNTIYEMFIEEDSTSVRNILVLRNLQEIFTFMDLSIHNTYNLSKFAGMSSK